MVLCIYPRHCTSFFTSSLASSLHHPSFNFNPAHSLAPQSFPLVIGHHLQDQASKTNAEAGQQTINDLLDQDEEVVHHILQAEQETREGGHERVQRPKKRG